MEPMVPMGVSSAPVADDGGGDDGVLPATVNDNDMNHHANPGE
jgi:hypothetical protein